MGCVSNLKVIQVNITARIQDKIGLITLNNPNKSNAMDVVMRDDLIQTYQEFEKNPDVRIIVLIGSGKNFCTGADLKHMYHMTQALPEENYADAKKYAELYHVIYRCVKPTLCFAHGKIMGGGLGLLAASDIAIATATAQFCFSEVRIGLVPAVISPYVTQRIHFQSAKYVMTTAEDFDSEKALKIGLIDHIADHPKVLLLAKSLLNNSQLAMEEMKKWLQTLRPITTEQIEQTTQLLAKMRASSDAREKLKVFAK